MSFEALREEGPFTLLPKLALLRIKLRGAVFRSRKKPSLFASLGLPRRALPATVLPILSAAGGYKIEHPPKPWRRRTSALLRIKLRRALNFEAAYGRQNWRVSGLSSVGLATNRDCLTQTAIIYCLTQHIKSGISSFSTEGHPDPSI